MGKIYIAGKITGDKNYKKKFESAEIDLWTKGYSVMNPARLGGGFEHKEYMHICYAMIDVCDSIYMLKGWRESVGAVMEYTYARKNNKEIVRQE